MEDPYEKIQRMADLRFRILVAVCLVAAGVAFYVKVRPFPFRFLKLASGVEAFELEVGTPLSALLESRGIDPQSVSEVWICDTRNESSLNYDTFPPPLAGGQEV